MKKQRAFRLFILMIMVMLAAAACGGDDSADVPARPVVRLQIGDQTYDGKLDEACWLQSTDNVGCAVPVVTTDSTPVEVREGDEVRFVVEGGEGKPESLIATLLDEQENNVQNLGPVTEASYDAELADGEYLVQVKAEYPDVDGKQEFVSYVFNLDIQGVVAMEPTTTPTDIPSPTPTEEPSATPTAEPTDTPTNTMTPTQEATEEPTEEPIDVVTEEPTAATVEPSTGVTTEEALVATVEALETEKPVAVETEIIEPVTTTPIPVASVTPGVTPEPFPIATTAAIPEDVPVITLNFAGRDYVPVGYQFCERIETGERRCVELPVTDTTARRISLIRGAAAQIQVSGERPNEVRLEYLSDSGITTGEPETRSGDNLILFGITPEPGTYILAIHITWSTEDATYFFRVTVSA